MKTIGIIGGFGPEATAQAYLQLTAMARPHILVRHVAVPRQLEHDALILGRNLHSFIPFLTGAAGHLEADGAEVVILPCNTLHIHERAIRAALSVPFVSIIDATIESLSAANVKRIGILGSRVTVQENLFRKKSGRISFVQVPAAIQKSMNTGLDAFVATGQPALLKEALAQSFEFFARTHIGDVLLACTDFHGLCPPGHTMRIHDTLDILVRTTVDML